MKMSIFLNIDITFHITVLKIGSMIIDFFWDRCY